MEGILRGRLPVGDTQEKGDAAHGRRADLRFLNWTIPVLKLALNNIVVFLVVPFLSFADIV